MQHDTLTERELDLLNNGFARLHNGRLIPVMRGGDPNGEGGEGGGEAGEGGSGGAGGVADRTFTQADVDRIVQERVARVKQTPPDDYEDLKAAAAKLAELESANKTELEKERERAEKAEREAQAATQRAKDIALRSAIVSEAAKKNVVDPDAAVALLDKSSLEFDDDGTPKNIAEAMDALLEAKPYLVGGGSNGTRQTGAADQGARGNGGKQISSTDGMSPEEILKAVEDGSLTNYLQSSNK